MGDGDSRDACPLAGRMGRKLQRLEPYSGHRTLTLIWVAGLEL